MYKSATRFRQRIKEAKSVNIGEGTGSTKPVKGRASELDDSIVRTWSRSRKRKAAMILSAADRRKARRADRKAKAEEKKGKRLNQLATTVQDLARRIIQERLKKK